MSNCNCNTEIIRDGSSQLDRYLQALDPAYAPVDGRSLEDLLVFAKRYAARIRFYDIPESKINDDTDPGKLSWSEFFRRDMAVLASSVATLDAGRFKLRYDAQREALEQAPDRDKYVSLYHIVLEMAAQIDQWYRVAVPGNPLRTDLDLAIDAHLRGQMQRVIAYEEGYRLIDAKHPLQLDYTIISNDALWGLDDAIDPDATIYDADNFEDKLRNAALYADELFNSFYSFISNLVEQSDRYLQFALEQYPGHQPHMALFIAFLKLFRLAQEQMNGLTGRMLDFYYKEVLQLQAKDALPDRAHIVFELAKEVTEYSLDPGTALKAGKDSGGIEQVYATDTGLVINQAKVKELKTIFIEKTPLQAGPEDKTLQTIYARPVANSADGYGAPFLAPNPKWYTFGKGVLNDKQKSDTCAVIRDMEDAGTVLNQTQIGFAIASPQLVLQGGNRLISWKLDGFSEIFREKELDSNNGDAAEKDLLIVLSGEEGWLPVVRRLMTWEYDNFNNELRSGAFPRNIDTSFYYHDRGGNTLHVYLPVAEKAIVPYNAKLHAGKTFVTQWPVMQVLLGPDVKIDEGRFNALRFNDLSLSVRVGSHNLHEDSLMAAHFDGLKKLVLQNDDGLITPGKPFDPFTAYPLPGKSLYVGSSEVFNKPLTELSIHIKHTMERNAPTSPPSSPPSDEEAADQTAFYRTSILEQKSWNELKYDKQLFSEATLSKDLFRDRYFPYGYTQTDRKPIAFYDKVDDKTTRGFVQLKFSTRDYNNNSFLKDNKLSDADNSAWQALAMKFQVKEISVSYASELRNLDQEIDQFFHVYPFGAIETYTIPYVEQPQGSPPYNYFYDTPNYARKAALQALPGAQPATFEEMDRQRGWLLVDADERLLPHFTYKSVYALPEAPVASPPVKHTKPNMRRLKDGSLQEVIVTGNKRSVISNQYAGKIQEEGMLFIGLENAKPLQTLSMLFQFAEGSAEDEDNEPPAINWSYLSNNEWKPMRGEDIVSDGTYGFQTTGIVKVNIPGDATDNNTIITAGLHWLCASVTKDANRIPMLIDIRTQAVTVTFRDNNNDATHYDKALPAGTIAKLASVVPEVSKVEQPFASFDGKHKEAGREYYQRVSERLRHKHRAITPWDYEHLVLDRFATVYKVKCISHTDPECLCRDTVTVSGGDSKTFMVPQEDPNGGILLDDIAKELLGNTQLTGKVRGYGDGPEGLMLAKRRADKIVQLLVKYGIAAGRLSTEALNGTDNTRFEVIVSGYPVTGSKAHCCGPQVAPGHVLIVPVADLKNRNSINPLQPKTGRRVLLDIERYLQGLSSPFVKIHARNPVYEEILTSFAVKFYTGTDQGYFLKVLNDELVRFLTPWAFDEQATFRFGQKVYASSIINFIEERPYVDFITDFEMRVCMETCCPEPAGKRKRDDKFSPADLSGCDAIENLIGDALKDSGAIVARPSGPRSILVSAPRHQIRPYVAPILETPCEQRQKMKKVKPAPVTDTRIDPVDVKDRVKDVVATDHAAVEKETATGVKTKTEALKDTLTVAKDATVSLREAKAAVAKKTAEEIPAVPAAPAGAAATPTAPEPAPAAEDAAATKKVAAKKTSPAKRTKIITIKKTDK